jgi:tRNA dimethylallyltransferase
VKRGLERWWERGGSSQDESAVRSSGRKARFRTLVFWVYEPMDTLKPRLDRRVDKMIEVSTRSEYQGSEADQKNGLLREIAELRGIAKEVYGTAEAVDHTEGIFQAIGRPSSLPGG